MKLVADDRFVIGSIAPITIDYVVGDGMPCSRDHASTCSGVASLSAQPLSASLVSTNPENVSANDAASSGVTVTVESTVPASLSRQPALVRARDAMSKRMTTGALLQSTGPPRNAGQVSV